MGSFGTFLCTERCRAEGSQLTDFRPGEPAPPPSAGRGRRRTPVALSAGIIVLGIVSVALLVAVLARDPAPIGGDPSASEGGSASPTSSDGETPAGTPTSEAPTATPGPTPVVATPDEILPPGSVATVTVESLRIREGPTTTSDIVATADDGDLIYVADFATELGPMETDGFLWYPVEYAGGQDVWHGTGPVTSQAGWAAAGSGAESYLEVAPFDCPDGEPTLQVLGTMTAWERLACFSGRQLMVEGTFGCSGCGGVALGTYEPEWLAYPLDSLPITGPADGGEQVSIIFRQPPDAPPLPEPGTIIRATLHLDDAAATDCEIAPQSSPDGPTIPRHPLAAELYCREQLVIEAYESLGTDPTFEGG